MAKKPSGPGGQPTAYRAEFHPQDFIRLSKQGKNLAQIALAWDLHRDTLYEWQKVHKEFSDAVKKGREFSEAWYTDLGQLAMLGQAQVNGQKVKVDIGLYVWLTKNLFKWSDKIEQKNEHTGSNGGPIELTNKAKVKKVIDDLERDY